MIPCERSFLSPDWNPLNEDENDSNGYGSFTERCLSMLFFLLTSLQEIVLVHSRPVRAPVPVLLGTRPRPDPPHVAQGRGHGAVAVPHRPAGASAVAVVVLSTVVF